MLPKSFNLEVLSKKVVVNDKKIISVNLTILTTIDYLENNFF